MASAPLPGYTALRAGLPAGRMLGRRWRVRRPDVVHVATEGPLGWSAVAAARRLGIPLSSSFHTHFHSFAPHYHAGPRWPSVVEGFEEALREVESSAAAAPNRLVTATGSRT